METDVAKCLMRIETELGKLASRIDRLDVNVDELNMWRSFEEEKDERESLYEIVDRGTPLDPWYGQENLPIGEKELKALRDGKILYHTDGEYAHAIYFEGYGFEPNWRLSQEDED